MGYLHLMDTDEHLGQRRLAWGRGDVKMDPALFPSALVTPLMISENNTAYQKVDVGLCDCFVTAIVPYGGVVRGFKSKTGREGFCLC